MQQYPKSRTSGYRMGRTNRGTRTTLDYNADETKTGFGMMFRPSHDATCVSCHLNNRHRVGHSWRMGKDEHFEDIYLEACNGRGLSDTEFKEVRVKKAGRTLGKCHVLFKFMPRGGSSLVETASRLRPNQ